ncbi:tRNA (guanosine(18)-2'-O)-methyltransferase TrmH [Wenzhouxiangella sp. XN79A]|uniref:tRNA (guanosine(18)-2'-O)-methyltransferase TrmH n=1 Tax=Wenzhouxiangella sp. XN79A TaxID=2724193 RepID=UPI00144AC567|nr:tRNA (guanosine(18)-2'-O)-methyltransferase TrmH [Wenzhouxiangella sp. XN79A]NKI35027.1 tRNA (guanosine(18)-2'-O)-methyltransferase TrmH [Wenzhouxiangella sp. XN79A]
MTPERRQRIEATACSRQHDLTVFMERVHKPHNLAAVLRTCDAVGIQRAHAVPGSHGLPSINTTSQGAQRWIDLERHPDTATALGALKAAGFACYAAHFSERAVDFRSVDYTRPTALVLGTEKFGVSDEALALCDGEVIVPMAGMTQSLNVSVAAAVILYEAQRQREVAGLYAPRDPKASPQKELIERWVVRDLARRKTPVEGEESGTRD